MKVPVNEDYLFDVDIERRELGAVYWLGPIYEVRRGTWFYQEGSVLRPCEENLATQLEEGYLKVKPFRYPRSDKTKLRSDPATHRDESKPQAASDRSDLDSGDLTPKPSIADLRNANHQASQESTSNNKSAVAPTSHEPQTHRLFGTYMNSIVTYQDDTIAWLSSEGIVSWVSSTVYQRFAGGGYLGGVKLVRGYTEVIKPPKPIGVKPEAPATSSLGLTRKPSDPGLQLDERQQRILKRRSAPPGIGAAPTTAPSDQKDTGQISAEPQEAVLKRQISSMVIDSMDDEKGEEALRKREEKDIQTDYIDHDSEDQSRKIEHLILVTHGIGQRLGMRYDDYDCSSSVGSTLMTWK